jgi:hypothetical protein
VAYGNGVFVAVASDGSSRVMTSTDGETWTARTAAEANSWRSVVFGNGVFVAVASTGTNQVMTSTNGETWTARSAAGRNSWNSVVYGNGVFVAVAGSGTNRVMTSTNGETWTARSAAEARIWQSVTYGNGVFVAVASDGSSRVMTSTDGETWTAGTASEASFWSSVTYGNCVFVAVATFGTNRVMTSTNGETWRSRSAEANAWRSVTFGNGVFVALASDGSSRVMTSADGETWTARTAAAESSWFSVAYGNGVFVAVGNSGTNRVMTSGVYAPPISVPAAPTSLVATPGDGSVSIAFAAGADGGAAITKYQYKVGSGSWTDAVGTSSPIAITGLTNYATNSVRLRAVNSAGAGAASTGVSVWPRIAGSTLTSVKAQGTTGIRASFAALTPVGGTTSHYWVYAYAKNTNTVVSSCRSTAAARGCLINGLSANTEYDVAVRGFFTLTGSSTALPTFDSTRSTVRTKS